MLYLFSYLYKWTNTQGIQGTAFIFFVCQALLYWLGEERPLK